MNRYKVLFVCSVYLPNVGGIETTIKYLSQHYRNLGYEVSVLTKKHPSDLPEYEVIDGVSIIRIPRPKDRNGFFVVGEILKKYEAVLQANVIHVIGVRRPMPLVAFALAKRWKVPLLFNYAGGDIPMDEDSLNLWREGRYTVQPFLYLGTGHIAFSDELINVVADNTGIRKESIHKIFGFIDASQFTYSNHSPYDNPYIFSARRLEIDKGIDLLIRAFSYLVKDMPQIHLCIAGDGNQRKNLEKLTQDFGLHNRVKFLGTLDYQEMLNWMHHAQCHICPSRVEGGGLVNIEASYAGTIPIGSNVGGIPEYILDGNTGFLFQSESIEDLVDKISLALQEPHRVQKMIQQGKKWSSKFKIETIANQYLVQYKNTPPISGLYNYEQDLPHESKKFLQAVSDGFQIKKRP